MGWIEREYTVSLHSPQLSIYLCSPSLIPLSKITTNQRTLLIKLQACNSVMPTQFSIIRKSTIFWTNYLSRFFSKLHCQSLDIRKTVFAHKLTNEYFNFIKWHKYLFKSRSSSRIQPQARSPLMSRRITIQAFASPVSCSNFLNMDPL